LYYINFNKRLKNEIYLGGEVFAEGMYAEKFLQKGKYVV